MIVIPVTAPNVLNRDDLYDHIETPLTQVPTGPGLIKFFVEIVWAVLGNLFNFLWLPGNSAEPGNGPMS